MHEDRPRHKEEGEQDETIINQFKEMAQESDTDTGLQAKRLTRGTGCDMGIVSVVSVLKKVKT